MSLESKEEVIARMKVEGDKARAHAEHQRKQRAKDRREKIATAVLAGMAANGRLDLNNPGTGAGAALMYADALIQALDKETP